MEYQNKLSIDVNQSRVFRNELQLDGTVKKKGFLTFIDFLYIIPAYASEEFITFGSTVKTKNDFNILVAVTLDYKKGLSFLIESENGKFGTIKEDNMTYLESFMSLYKNVIKPLLLSQTNQQLVDEFTEIINALYVDLDDRRIKSWLPELPVETEPKFNIGDKVIRKGSQQVMTVIKRIYDGDEESFDYDLKFEDDSYESYFENELEPYEATPKDCESDASLIVSGQVKKFYDLNKPRIEKLKTEFSCKIVKALIYLSEYEKCGKPSKIKLPQQKDDLLSEIKNLKF
jgi:hypothetical protein